MKLNVLLVCYNQAEFIEQCVNSILMQETDFDFNIIVADDCSKDGTLEKIKRLAENSGREFVFLDSGHNRGITENYKRSFAACEAEYIAVMEGDDFWTTPERLQKHADFLDMHYECAMTSNSRLVMSNSGASYGLFPEQSYKNSLAGWKVSGDGFMLAEPGNVALNHLGTNFSACVYRKSAIDALPEDYWQHPLAGDHMLSIVVCLKGLLGFLLPVMNVYRVHAKGAMGSMPLREQWERGLANCDMLDEYTHKLLHGEFTQMKQGYETQLKRLYGNALMDVLKRSKLKPFLRFAWRLTPPFIMWILKAIIPKWIMDKLHSKLSQS